MENENKIQEFAENEVCKEVASEHIAEPVDVSYKCQPGHLKPHKCHKCRFVIICFMLSLQIVTVGLLGVILRRIPHRMRRHGDFRPPIHRFEEDYRRGQRGGFKSSVSEEPVREEEPKHEQRPEMGHEGVSDMHEQADPDTQAM